MSKRGRFDWRAAFTAACLAIGLLLLATGMFTVVRHAPAEAADSVAIVNSRPISKREFEAASHRVGATAASDRATLLDYLVNEELLVQRGVSLGLLASHPRIRKLVVRREIDQLDSSLPKDEPVTAELARFYAARETLFAQPRTLRVDGLVGPGQCERETTRRIMTGARRELERGVRVADAKTASGTHIARFLPAEAVTAASLAQHIGDPIVDEVLALGVGRVTSPHAYDKQCFLVRLLEDHPAVLPPLQEVRAKLLNQYRSELRDAALQRLLEERRRATPIEIHLDEIARAPSPR